MNDTTPEIEKIQFEMMMKMPADRRIALACEMFMSSRELFLNSLPKNLSENEIKKKLFYRTYGENLPDDFFEKNNKG